MTNRKLTDSSKKILPFFIAGALGIAGCSGEQAGDTNGGLSGGLVGGVPSTTVLGVVGGVALAGLLLDSDDSDAGANANDGNGNGGGSGGDDGSGDGDGDGSGDDDGSGGSGNDDGSGGSGGGDGSGGSGDDDGSGGSGDGDGSGGNGSGGGAGTSVLGETGDVTADLLESEAVVGTGTVGSGSSGSASTNLTFNRNAGSVNGSVTVSGINANRVDIMVGPPGTNGFVAVALEGTPGGSVWMVPASLSAAQTAFVLQNLNSGNLYVAARTDDFPEGELRRQLTPDGVVQYTTTNTNANGTANGYLLVNTNTGHYSITLNTTDATLASAHVNDGMVSNGTENDYAPLSQRQSNPAQFFRDGNYTLASDPLYSDAATLPARVAQELVWLDAHSADDTRVFLGQLE